MAVFFLVNNGLGDEIMASTEQLLDGYYKWLSESYQVNQLDDSDEIVTPFTDVIGDNITLYLSTNCDGSITLDDDGYTLNNLELMNVTLSRARNQVVERILRQYKIKREDDLLSVSGQPVEFPRMKLNLTSAILKIGDLVFTQRKQVKSMFADDVVKALNANDLGGLKSSFVGRSGIEYLFPYVVAPRKTHPLKVVEIANRISTDKMMRLAYQFIDVKRSAAFDFADPKFLIIYNNQEAKLSPAGQKIAVDSGIITTGFDNLDFIRDVLAS